MRYRHPPAMGCLPHVRRIDSHCSHGTLSPCASSALHHPSPALDFRTVPPMLRPDEQENAPMIPVLFGLLFAGFWLALVVLVVAGMWKAFVKAGQPGWAVLIPIYNMYVLLKAAGKPGWWLLLMLIPIVG